MSYSLLLRRLPERDSAELTVRADDTVATICQRAAVAFGRAEADAARLCCFRGEVLPPTATLSAAGVTAAHFAVVCFAPCAPALTRVCGGKGWVVHGVVLEFSDGVRTGYFGENDGSPMALSDDAGLARRGGVWYDVRPGEKLVMVTGRDSSMGYLCGSVTLQLSSGRAISVAGENPSVFGGAFTHAVPEQPASSRYVEPRFDAGRCTGLHRCGQPPPSATAPAAPAGAAEPSGEPPRVLNSVAQLLSWRPPAGAAAVAARAPSAPRAALPPRPRTLHCHDMAGGYNAKADGAYLAAFSGWEEVGISCSPPHLPRPRWISWLTPPSAHGAPGCLPPPASASSITSSSSVAMIRSTSSSTLRTTASRCRRASGWTRATRAACRASARSSSRPTTARTTRCSPTSRAPSYAACVSKNLDASWTSRPDRPAVLSLGLFHQASLTRRARLPPRHAGTPPPHRRSRCARCASTTASTAGSSTSRRRCATLRAPRAWRASASSSSCSRSV